MRKAFKYFLKVGLRLTRSRELIRSRAGAGGTSKGKNKFRQNGPSSALMAKQSEKTGFSDFWGFIRSPQTAFQQGVNINTSGIFRIPGIFS